MMTTSTVQQILVDGILEPVGEILSYAVPAVMLLFVAVLCTYYFFGVIMNWFGGYMVDNSLKRYKDF